MKITTLIFLAIMAMNKRIQLYQIIIKNLLSFDLASEVRIYITILCMFIITLIITFGGTLYSHSLFYWQIQLIHSKFDIVILFCWYCMYYTNTIQYIFERIFFDIILVILIYYKYSNKSLLKILLNKKRDMNNNDNINIAIYINGM